MKKVQLNTYTTYDYFYDKIYNCDDLELIGSDKKAYGIINKLIKVRKTSVDKNLYDPNNIVVHKADISLNNLSSFVGLYFVSGTGFDISEEIQTVKDCLKDEVFEFELGDTLFLEPDNWFFVIPAIEPDHQYDIIVFRDILIHALNNYKPIHLENGKLVYNSPKDFDPINYVLGNLGLVIPRYVVERIFILLNIVDYNVDNVLSTKFASFDLYFLQLVAIYKYLQKVYGWNTSELKKYLLQLTIDIKYPSILFGADYKFLNTNRKVLKYVEEIANVNDEIKNSFIDFSILLYDTCNLSNPKSNIKLVKK